MGASAISSAAYCAMSAPRSPKTRCASCVSRGLPPALRFEIAPETIALMRGMVDGGEVDHLVPERAWQELARGLMETRPSLMIEALRACGALARILPEVDALFGVPQPPQYHPEVDTGLHILLVIDYAASRHFTLPVRFAALTHDLGKGRTPQGPLAPPHRA